VIEAGFAALFGSPGARFGEHRALGEWVEVVERAVHRCEVHPVDDASDRFELTVFHPISGLSAELWEHEMRALLSLSAVNHPSLPEIVDGGTDEEWQLAFCRTRSIGLDRDQLTAIEALRADPLEALRQFDVLLDALRRIHDNRILHRNVCPDALRFVDARVDTAGHVVQEARIVLTRFEMSTLVSNLVRTSSVDTSATAAQLRGLLAGPPPGPERARHRAFLPPERIPFVCGDSRLPNDRDTSDLYALGVLAFELFFGPLDGLDGLGDLDGDGATVAHERLRQQMRAQTTRRRTLADDHIPSAICELVAGLLELDPRSRWNAYRAASFLEDSWNEIVGIWRPVDEAEPLLVAFMPNESATTLYDHRRWLKTSPREPAGRRELQAWFEHELRNAEVVHSPEGAIGYANHTDKEVLRQAEWVLIGEQAVWFCAYLRIYGVPEERVLLIKFIRERDQAINLLRIRPRRRLGKIDLFAWEPMQSVEHLVEGRPSWRSTLDAVRKAESMHPDDLAFLGAMDFLLEYQQVELDAREYAVTAVDDETIEGVLRVDRERELARRHASPLLDAFSADTTRRPPLATFVGSLSDDASPVVRLEMSAVGRVRPSWKEVRDVELLASPSGDLDVIRVRSTDGRSFDPASRYWIRPAADRYSRIAIDRQVRARPSLSLRPTLVSKLREPVSMEIRWPRWEDIDPNLKGEAPDVVSSLLADFPIHAVQGPPGTGKTTVATEALRLFLADDPAARVLVSAQSNFALDNIGVRIVDKLESAGIEGHVVREVPKGFDLERLSPAMRRHTIGALAGDEVRDIGRQLERTLAEDGSLSSADRRILLDWKESVAADEVEIAHRLRRTAAVVLATCSTAAARLSDAADPAAGFDWVIVEEAAKAWPTELIIPLLLAPRWTLIGDHKQLGAFRQEDVHDFVANLASDPSSLLASHVDRWPDYKSVLEVFGSMFEGDEADDGRRATSRLSLQFRMDEDIAEPVSRAFYPADPPRRDDVGPIGFLQTHPRADPAHPFVRPGVLVGHSLVWIDTTGDPRCGDEPYWYNDGEVALVTALYRSMEPAPVDADLEGERSVAILTPYRRQVQRLESELGYGGRIHTVHSFQGREADCTIVSLVRDRRRGPGVRGNLGHLDKPELANVLLSRARRLNVLVGSFEHFARHGSEHWRTVCGAVEARGTIVPSEDVT
jgi:serine/threonine protein kinase